MRTEAHGHPRARTRLPAPPKETSFSIQRSSSLLWLCQPPCHEGPQTQHGGHLWHVEDFPSTLNSCRRCPTSRLGMLVRPSGIHSMERRPRAWRTMANRWDKPAGAAPMPGPTAGQTRTSGAARARALLPTVLRLGAGRARRQLPALPSTAGRQEASPFPSSNSPEAKRLRFKKPTVMPEKNPSPPPSEGAPAAPCSGPEPLWVAGQDFGSSCPSSPGDAAPSSAHAGRVQSPCRALAPTNPCCSHAHAPRLVLSPPCPLDGLMLYPYINPSMFLSKTKAWSTRGPCRSSAGGAALQGGHWRG